MTDIRRRPALAALALVALLVAAIPLLSGTRAAAADSTVHVVHGIPGVTVDVYAGGSLALPGFAPGTVSPGLVLPQGDLPVQVFAAVDDPAPSAADRSDEAVITQTLTVPSGADVSVVANVEGGTPNLAPFANDLSPVAEGSARVTVRHVADAPAVDVVVDGTVAVPALAPGVEASAVIPAGEHTIEVRLTDGTPLPALSPGAVTIPAAKNVIVYAVGSATAADLPLGLVQQVLDVAVAPAPAPGPAPAPSPAPAPEAPEALGGAVPAPARPAMATPRVTG